MGFLDGFAVGGFAPVVSNGNPTSGWDKVPVFGKWRAYDGTPIAGTYTVTYPVDVSVPSADTIYPAGSVGPTALDTNAANYSLNFQALANDDPDITPNSGWRVTVHVTLVGYGTRTYVLDTPLASLSYATPGVNLRTLTPV